MRGRGWRWAQATLCCCGQGKECGERGGSRQGGQDPKSNPKNVVALLFHDDLCPGVVWPGEGGVWEPLASLSSFARVLGLGGTWLLTSAPPRGTGHIGSPCGRWHCERSHWKLEEFPAAGESPARGWAAGEGGAGGHRHPGLEESQVWGPGSFCLDRK